MNEKTLAVANVVVTVITLACGVVSGVIASETMKGEVAKEVTRQMAEAAKESV